ncbi:beta-lactamase/transpeptidase-like protein [Dactylonectria macrodidyma]|uniref:Beta-lactamase/transpeptidase-like protein n=1 Tax=Dactylonectria macrodidyma TaxID=307937 RepID=A0A9P9D0M3_9HYPO|nr:beta-lactamase/transpeptidase-like protein [Dactylonectria macrodidyma]
MAVDSPRLTLDSSGWIASMTKIVTATALMQLVERKLIDLDDDVRPLVPELAAVQILKPTNTGGEIVLENNSAAITLRQLLTHSSGMSYDAVDPDLQKWSKSIGRTSKTLDQTREGWNTPLRFAPGSSWMYGSGIDWAGQVLEKVTGQTLGAYMSENIFKPLGMGDTTFRRQDIAEQLTGRIADCCYRTPDGSLVAGPLPVSENPPQDSGGAGLFSTAKDYAVFIQALLSASQGEGTLLRRTSVDEMFRPQLNDSQGRDMHALIKDIIPFPADIPMNHGISGVINLADVDGKRRKGTLTWGGMTNPNWVIPLPASSSFGLEPPLLTCVASGLIAKVVSPQSSLFTFFRREMRLS